MNLLSHRKSKHLETVAVCRKYLEGRCPFSSGKCWWNHKQMEHEKVTSASCYTCRETFDTKRKMMTHRKTSHRELVSKCNNFTQNKCIFADKGCWFLHDDDKMEIDDTTNENIHKNDQADPVFQKVFSNVKPPIAERIV